MIPIHFLIVAHAPLASALRSAGLHAFPDLAQQVTAVDIEPTDDLGRAQDKIHGALKAGTNTLMLLDVFGATPCNATQRTAHDLLPETWPEPWAVVTGINLPGLWRLLCYADLPFDQLVERAVEGIVRGALVLETSLSARVEQREESGS